MATVVSPIVRKIKDTREALEYFEKHSLLAESDKDRKIIAEYPTVYIHNWNDSSNYEVYVGESNNIINRTLEHYGEAKNPNSWQSNLLTKDASLYIIGHEHFNKSLTLDIENRLYQYMLSVDSVKRVHNGRGNAQGDYYPAEEFETIFNKIWRKLRADNMDLFPSLSSIKDSAIFKASPFHKLTQEQEKAKNLIISKVQQAFDNKTTHQIVFIDGEAGTGKTVLNSSTFYDLYCKAEEDNKDIKCYLLVNHDEQITVYEQIADKLGLTEKYGKIVYKPTSFINSHSDSDLVDVVFIDEAHLLLTQGKQSYQGNNQLQDIIDRSKVTVIMFDENQILNTEQYWEAQILQRYREMAQKSDSYIVLDKQLRMRVDSKTQDWIDSFTKAGVLKKIPKDSTGYTIKVFDTPKDLDRAIKNKAKDSNTSLSRLIATYDWEYSSNHAPDERIGRYWEVLIGNWHKPWNRELEKTLSKKEKQHNKRLAWAEQPQTINEVGSTFTIQGFDLNYAGVILGPSVKYRDGRIIFDPNESCDNKATRNRTLSNGYRQSFGEMLIQHAVRVLMTRGVNGLFIYACDSELRNALIAVSQ